MNLRLKRLANDSRELKRFLKGHPRISLLNAVGDPPERYQIEYRIKGLEKKGDEIVMRDKHAAEIVLPLDYPAIEPKCRMLTPVFHPNISPQVICHTDNWAAGESLVDVVLRIGEMISYQNYNIKSPRNGEAARWAETNAQRFPIDPVDLSVIRPAEDDAGPEEPDIAAEPECLPETPVEREKEPAPKKAVQEAVPEIFVCANCGTKRESVPFQKCSQGHTACPDCLILCEACGKSLCVLCPLARCPVCGKIICGDCSKTCPACGRTLCQGHVHGPEGLCSECSASSQAKSGSGSQEPGRSEAGPEPRPVPGRKCPACGRIVVRADALYCEFCGTKL